MEKFEIKEQQNIFFTSDTHFGHVNILKYCSRPFSDVETMNNSLIKNWNEKVKPNDIVFHLGDVGFDKNIKEILYKLNGKIYLILGNHDKKIKSISDRFESIENQKHISINGQKIYLNHFPFLCFAGSYGNMNSECHTWQLFGHVHSGPYTNTGLDHQRLRILFPTQYDVGVDNNNFTPISFNEVKTIITDQLLSQNLYRGTLTKV